MKQYLSADERRERTVETVIALCARDDPATITTGDIAKHMRVTQGALFRHFPSKAAIWEAVASSVAERVMARITAAAEEVDDPLLALRAMFMAHVRFIAEHPGVPRLLMGQLQHPQPTPAGKIVRRLIDTYRGRLLELLGRARDAGEIREGLSLDAAATQFIGTIQGLVMQSLIAGDVHTILEQAPAAFDILLGGIGGAREAAA